MSKHTHNTHKKTRAHSQFNPIYNQTKTLIGIPLEIYDERSNHNTTDEPVIPQVLGGYVVNVDDYPFMVVIFRKLQNTHPIHKNQCNVFVFFLNVFFQSYVWKMKHKPKKINAQTNKHTHTHTKKWLSRLRWQFNK